MVCRNKERGEKARGEIVEKSKNERVHLHLADVSSFGDVRRLAKDFLKSGSALDVLVNNAGVLFHQKSNPSADGLEITLATNMLGGFLLTNLLLPVLQKSSDGRVILVSSGGGLTEKLTLRAAYDKAANGQPYDEALGRQLYALTKRQQIVMAELYKEKLTQKTGVGFYSMHPGWCDTEGLSVAMPSFYNFMKEKLRTIDEGSDTIQWLAVSPSVDKIKHGGLYFRDRKDEIKHLPLGGTGYSADQAEDLWKWCCELTQWKDDDLDADVSSYEKTLKKLKKAGKSSETTSATSKEKEKADAEDPLADEPDDKRKKKSKSKKSAETEESTPKESSAN